MPSFDGRSTNLRPPNHQPSWSDLRSFEGRSSNLRPLNHQASWSDLRSFEGHSSNLRPLNHQASWSDLRRFDGHSSKLRPLDHQASMPGPPSFRAWSTKVGSPTDQGCMLDLPSLGLRQISFVARNWQVRASGDRRMHAGRRYPSHVPPAPLRTTLSRSFSEPAGRPARCPTRPSPGRPTAASPGP
jgi:hypothetical protein